MKDKITKEKLIKYLNITEKALKMAENNIDNKMKEDAEKILIMVRCYLSDAKHFEKQGDKVNAFGAINYAHGWLDCGARLGIFNVKDDKLFTAK